MNKQIKITHKDFYFNARKDDIECVKKEIIESKKEFTSEEIKTIYELYKYTITMKNGNQYSFENHEIYDDLMNQLKEEEIIYIRRKEYRALMNISNEKQKEFFQDKYERNKLIFLD